MPDEKAPQGAPAPQPAKSRPEPPPFRPNKDLIGYIEKGQKPPVRPASPSEKRHHRRESPFSSGLPCAVMASGSSRSAAALETDRSESRCRG